MLEFLKKSILEGVSLLLPQSFFDEADSQRAHGSACIGDMREVFVYTRKLKNRMALTLTNLFLVS